MEFVEVLQGMVDALAVWRPARRRKQRGRVSLRMRTKK
jgi:hypothetical protein